MLKKIIPIILIFFTGCIVVFWCRWHNVVLGFSSEKLFSDNSIPADCSITSPVVHTSFTPVKQVVEDTTIVCYTSSDIK